MLYQVTREGIPALSDILQKNIDQCRIAERTTVEYCMANILLHTEQGIAGVWVNDLETPTCLLVVSVGKFGVLDEKICFINSVFIDNDKASPALFKEMLDTAEAYGRSKTCDACYGSSWTYAGCKDTSSLWKANGFSSQETIFTKTL